MSSISHCPNCGQLARVPADLDPETVVRCPICEAEFPINQVGLSFGEPSPEDLAEDPPELLPVAHVAGVEEPAAVAGGTEAEAAVAGESAAGSAETPLEPSAPDEVEAAPLPQRPLPDIDGDQPPAVAQETTSAEETSGGESPEAGAPSGAPPSPGEETSQPLGHPAANPAEAAATASLEGDASATPVFEDATLGHADAGAEAVEHTVEHGDAQSEAAHESHEVAAQADTAEASAAAALQRWRQQRKQHPVRNAIGVVVSGLLGLAVAYALLTLVGVPGLKFWRGSKPRAADAGQAKQKSESEEPASWDEFPGLDEGRFAEGAKDVQPARSKQPDPKRSGVRKGP